MVKTKIFVSSSYHKLEKEMNEFLEKFTNAEVLHVTYQAFKADSNKNFSSLIIYRIDEKNKLGSA